MFRCPNCGLKANGDYCQCCHYPILRGVPTRGRKSKKQEAIAAKEKAKQEAAEAKQAKEAEKRAKLEAEQRAKEKVKQEAIAAKEKAKQEAAEAKQVKEAEKWTKQLESIREELNSGKIGTKEAIERFKALISHIKLGT